MMKNIIACIYCCIIGICLLFFKFLFKFDYIYIDFLVGLMGIIGLINLVKSGLLSLLLDILGIRHIEKKIGKRTISSIDNSIVELIKELNRKGYKTIYSCSAMEKDHDNCSDKFPSYSGYIWFKSSNIKAQKLISISIKLGFDIDICFNLNPFKKSICIYQHQFHLGTDPFGTDIERDKSWDNLLSKVIDL
ncbi:hypothetical protein [Clostridium estertheticum]|uniref:hypothetical protein n=1 Tax=Clostridium estertheticum TaxID=238834 RepID=UPI001C0DD61D|nr:hypothetical protein [Clostridium estertheticum]MBU3173333.1 hypothetical protein [Clostridium estertheticum]